jgi:hypothetical protein
MSRTLSGSIALTKLKNVVETRKSKNGNIKVITLPIDANLLTVKDDAVYLNVRVHVRDEEDQYGQHGFIGQSVDSKTYKDGSDTDKEAWKKLPILGNIKDFSGARSGDASGTIELPADDGDDGLPF